jgi:hypothetical protein
MNFIEREFPAMRPRFERLYSRKYAPDAYRKEIKAMLGVLQDRYGLRKREDAEGAKDAEAQRMTAVDPEQVGFAW